MQLKIYQSLDTELVLPIGYHHILQSVIYHSLKEDQVLGKYLHEEGYSYSNRQFRMFTFGNIKGKYEIQRDKIVFRDEIMFEVRSPEPAITKILHDYILKNGIRYGERQTEPSKIRLCLDDRRVGEKLLQIQMLSPVCVYSTDLESKKTKYYHPEEPEFAVRINENFHRKYCAYTGMEPKSDLFVSPISVQKKDKYVTRYKGYYITGYLGKYTISGEPAYLDFLYQTGLGSKNAQGFGMFKILKDKE